MLRVVEKFVTITNKDGIWMCGRDTWEVEISHGKYHISCNGSPICYGNVKPGTSCEQVIRSCCGKNFKRIA